MTNLRLNLKQLRTFYHVAKNLSFTRAAGELFVSQPGVQMQIGNLERHYGIKFFDRHNKRLTLTKAGEALYAYAERIMTLACEAEATILKIKAHPDGLLRIGASATWVQHLLPPYILNFQSGRPDVGLQLVEGNSQDIAASVLQGTADLGIVGRVPYDDQLEVIPFPGHEQDELVLVTAPQHRLAGRPEVDARDLRGEPLILREVGAATRFVVSRLFDSLGVAPSVLLEAGSVPFIKDLIRKGLGIAILPRLCVEDEVHAGALAAVSLSDGGLWLPIDIVLAKHAYGRAQVRLFLESLVAQPSAATEELARDWPQDSVCRHLPPGRYEPRLAAGMVARSPSPDGENSWRALV